MGAAKRNGTFEQRKAAAIVRRQEEARVHYGAIADRERELAARGRKPAPRIMTAVVLAALIAGR